jgi:apoptosis-inducing factor 2
MSTPKLLIVGGGYGGTNLAKALGTSFDVTVIEKRATFFHTVGALRALVDRNWPHKLFVPYNQLLKGIKVIQGEVILVEAKQVVLKDGRVLDFEYLVLATGSDYPFPAHALADGVAEATQAYQTLFERTRRAEQILIAGGGPVGLELAGEISSVYPDKSIVLVHSGQQLIGPPFHPKFGLRLQQQLEARGVRLILGEKLDIAAAQAAQHPSDLGAQQYRTDKGTHLQADLLLRAFGATPNTVALRQTFAHALDRAGRVKVNQHLQMEGHSNIFALGDITNIDEPKLAVNASRHAGIIAHNLKALRGQSRLKRYTPMSVPMTAIPLGPKGGAAHLPFGRGMVVDFLAAVKGKTLLTERFSRMIAASPQSPGHK